MNRQALRSVSPEDDSVSSTIRSAIDNTVIGTEALSSQVSSLAQDGKELADRSYAYASRTIRENPALALAGVVAIGALAALALRPRRTAPGQVASDIQRDLVKHTRQLRKIVRQELRDNGAADRFSDLGKTLSAVDWKPYVQPFIEQATAVAQQANDRLTGKSK
ncbi:MAG TPA: hypothetical protein PLD46_02570 [Hyphomicrobium sp.]|nr:hypothetical protein [Hyphomicrobium sp.]